MRIWPVILDSRPPYFGGAEGGASDETSCASLLFAPLGGNRVLDHLLSALQPITGNPPLIVPPEGANGDYASLISTTLPSAKVADTPESFSAEFSALELSDVLLIVDPRYMPVRGFQFSPIVQHYAADPRVCHHLVVFESGFAGTKERVSLDAHGQIRSIQRFYEQTTWPFVAGIMATLVPCACDIRGEGVPRSLLKLRQLLTGLGVPSRDVPIDGGVLDLAEERGILAANEHFVLKSFAARGSGADSMVCVGDGQRVDKTARFIGPVLLHRDVEIERGVTIIGPSVIGAGARLQSGAVIAHAVVGPGLTVPAAGVVRDAACFGGKSTSASIPDVPYRERLSRLSLDTQVRAWFADGIPASSRFSASVKRAIDFVIAAVGLAILSPVVALVAIAIWFESGGPVFYGDKREGRGGRVFRCWKFRTMHTGAHLTQRFLTDLDHTDGPHFKIDSDPRVTKVGHLLRTLNLDEVPQLFNVLAGEMSLVGPRPSPFRENQVCVPWREARLSVRPGITGFWQVCRHNRAAGDFHQWIEYDLLYVQHLSLWLDVKILLATILTLGGKASHVPATRLVGSLASRDIGAVDEGFERNARAS